MADALLIGGASRPYPGEQLSGDAWEVVISADGVYQIVVVDGLGHGALAAEAAQRALEVFRQDPTLALEALLRRCHAALVGTRGAALAVARIDPVRGRLVYAGVGNVEARLRRGGRGGKEERPISYRGIVGAVLPTPRSFEYELGASWTLLLYTDGIQGRFRMEDVPAPSALEDPADTAQRLLEAWGRQTDDATLVLVGPAV